MVIYVPVLCALWSVIGYYSPMVLIVGRKKPVFEGQQTRGQNLFCQTSYEIIFLTDFEHYSIYEPEVMGQTPVQM